MKDQVCECCQFVTTRKSIWDDHLESEYHKRQKQIFELQQQKRDLVTLAKKQSETLVRQQKEIYRLVDKLITCTTPSLSQ